jgi:stage V sporulation protein SpoVS
MVSPQERHTRVGVVSAKGGERSIAGVEGVLSDRGMCDSSAIGGSAIADRGLAGLVSASRAL